MTKPFMLYAIGQEPEGAAPSLVPPGWGNVFTNAARQGFDVNPLGLMANEAAADPDEDDDEATKAAKKAKGDIVTDEDDEDEDEAMAAANAALSFSPLA